jgi:hypothetical protein
MDVHSVYSVDSRAGEYVELGMTVQMQRIAFGLLSDAVSTFYDNMD